MRERKEIEYAEPALHYGHSTEQQNHLILEVLLDIRDLLSVDSKKSHFEKIFGPLSR